MRKVAIKIACVNGPLGSWYKIGIGFVPDWSCLVLHHAQKWKMSQVTKLNDFSGKSFEFVGQWLDYFSPGVGNLLLTWEKNYKSRGIARRGWLLEEFIHVLLAV